MHPGVRLITLCVAFAVAGCTPTAEPFGVSTVDRSISGSSVFPVAVHPGAVGTYPGNSKSGAGYFFDDVLEYRVWLHPENGAEPLAGKEDYFAAFAEYERARRFADSAKGAEQPLALVRQVEWVNEPAPGVFVWEKGERVTEWQVQWLSRGERTASSIPSFLAARASSVPQR